MYASDLHVPSVDEWFSSLSLGDLSFRTIYSTLEWEIESIATHRRIDIEKGERVQSFILLFVVSCDKLIKSPKVDKHDKIILKEKRRWARAFFIDISKRMERHPGYAWADAPLPNEQTADTLAEEWVRLGVARSKEEVFALQEKARADAKATWDEQRKDYTPSYAWSDAPLFGTPKKKSETEEE